MKYAIALLLLCVPVSAADFEWRIIDTEFRWSISERGGDPEESAQDVPKTDSGGTAPETAAPESVSKPSPGSVSETTQPSSPDTEPSTSVCPCRGSNRGVCHCLANKVTCRCSANVGSEWLLANGRAVSKTGRYLDPNSPLKTPPLNVSIEGSRDDTVPRKRADGRWWWKGPDGTWFGTATLAEGQTYVSGTNRFVYRDGKMVHGSVMAAQVAPQGRWVRRCYGGYCRMEWVPQ